MGSKKTVCVACKAGAMVPALVPVALEIAGHKFTATVTGSRCDACGDDEVPGPALQAFELAVARELVGTAPTGETVRHVRKALGLSGEALGALLGVRFETISRWERGLHPIDRQAWALLGLLVTDRARTEAALRTAATPVELPVEVPVRVA